MSVLRSILFYALFYGGSVVFVLAAVLASLGGQRGAQRVANGWSRYHRLCARVLLGIRVAVRGRPFDGPALYAIKHESFFEAIDSPTLFDLPIAFAKAELFDIPGWGRAARAYGLVPVNRGEGSKALRAMVRAAQLALKTGRPFIIFPEGTRVPHGAQVPLKAGFAGLYAILKLPVVPVAVDSGPLYHRRWKRSGTVTYRFGAPIPPGLDRDEMERRVVAAINALNR